MQEDYISSALSMWQRWKIQSIHYIVLFGSWANYLTFSKAIRVSLTTADSGINPFKNC